MTHLKQFTDELLNWYLRRARPFFRDHISQAKLDEFDRDGKRLQEREKSLHSELTVCFLGSSGVGKSTLLNAIVDGKQTLVPSGGVGPFTAQALEVRYGESPRMEVEYHGVSLLFQTCFGLEQMFKDEVGVPPSEWKDDVLTDGLDETDLPELATTVSEVKDPSDPAENTEREEKRQQWRRRAQLLVTGKQDQEREPRYLIDSLLEAAGKSRRWGTTARAEDVPRLLKIQKALAQKQHTMDGATEPQIFRQTVYDHAVGFLAPFIKNLTIQWPTPALQCGLTLVDLPGVGILRDAHKEITRIRIREQAKALVLVVDNRGITDSVGEALRQSEFLNSLLYSVDEPEDDPVVMVAVTRIDDIASEEYRKNPNKRKYQHFLDVCHEVRQRMRSDLQRQLEVLWLQADEVTKARKQVVRNLLNTLQVHPISAPEYNRLLAPNEDEPPFLRSVEQSGIPDLTKSLQELAARHRELLISRFKNHFQLYRDSLSTQLRLIEVQWGEQAHAREEAEKLREELENFLRPRREELRARQGAFREFLKNTVPQRINDLVVVASNQASNDIARYMKRIGAAHWATLRASVKRGGRYKGASDIDLPNEFALRFEEPIADAWGKHILRDVRARTRDYGADCIQLASEVTDWAMQQGARVQTKAVKAQFDALQTNAKKLESVGREMAKEMRDEVKARLVETIEKKIRQACNEFVRKNRHVGIGVKQRILELYGDLANEVASIARAPASNVLKKVYRDAEIEIQTASAEFQDPLIPFAEAIVATEEQRIARADALRRAAVLTELQAVSEKFPTAPEGW